MKKEQQQEPVRFAYSFNKSEYEKQSNKLKDIEKTLNEFRNLALSFTEAIPEDYSEILNAVNDSLSSQLGGKGIPVKVSEAMGLDAEYNTLVSFEKTLSNEWLLKEYGGYLTFKNERGYEFSDGAYGSLKERYTAYLTDEAEIELYKRIQAIIDSFVKLSRELDGGMWMDSIHRFGHSSKMFSMPESFRIVPNVSYIKSVVKAKKRYDSAKSIAR